MEQKEKKPEDYQIKSVWLKCFFDFKLGGNGRTRMMAKFQNFCSLESFFRDSCAVYLWPNHWHSLSFSSQTSLLFKAVPASDCSFAKWNSEISLLHFIFFLEIKTWKCFLLFMDLIHLSSSENIFFGRLLLEEIIFSFVQNELDILLHASETFLKFSLRKGWTLTQKEFKLKL